MWQWARINWGERRGQEHWLAAPIEPMAARHNSRPAPVAALGVQVPFLLSKPSRQRSQSDGLESLHLVQFEAVQPPEGMTTAQKRWGAGQAL